MTAPAAAHPTTAFAADDVTPLSGWYADATAEAPAGAPVVVAVHGGSYTSHYWSYASMGGATLAALGPAAGVPVIAVDRPGFGPRPEPARTYDEQVDLVLDTVAALLDGPLSIGRRRPVVLVGHSIGGMLSTLIMASHSDRVDVVGGDISGYAVDYRPGTELQRLRDVAALDHPVPPVPEARLSRFFGPAGSWDPAVGEEDVAFAAPTQPLDLGEAVAWPGRFRDVAARVEVPVQYTAAEHDSLWPSDAAAVEDMRSAFSSAPRFDGYVEAGVGHCLHLHHGADVVLGRAVDLAVRLGAEQAAR